MGKNQSASNLTNIIQQDASGNIVFTSGSTTLATISTAGQLSGSTAVLSAQTASFVQNAQSASYVLTAQTASFVTNAQTASFVALAQSASNAVSAQTSSFATEFTVAGTLTAQTLVVQTITSSVDFVTGSTRFGSSLSTSTHQFTGSVSITGSLAVVTNGTEFQVTSTGVNFGNVIGDAHNITGSVLITGSVGIGIGNPNSPLEVYAGSGSVFRAVYNGVNNIEIGNYKPTGNGGDGYQQLDIASSQINLLTGTAGGGSATSRIFITSGGYVGIGTTSNTSYQLRVSGANYGVLRGDAPSTPTLDLWQTALENAAARNWRLVTNYEAWGTLDFQVSTANNNGPSATRMTIASSGNVGIGNGTPSFILDINDTNASGVRGVRISASSSTVGPGLFLYINSGANTNWAVGNSYEIGNALEFRSSNSVGGNPGTAGTTRMLITNAGNVVVGNAAYQGTTTDLSITGDKVNSNGYYSRLIFQNSNQSGGSSASIRAERVTSNFATELTFYTNPTTPAGEGFERLRIQANGALRISNDAYFLCGSNGYRFNSSTDAFNNFIALDNGNATLRGTLTQNSSDERLKNNIQIIPNALNKISQLRGVTFEWNQEIYETSRTTDIGVIAQDVQSVLPDAVTLAPFDTNFETNTSKSGKNYLTVYYEKLIPLLIEGIKELNTKLDAANAEIEALKSR
jgi:hypothetical protein